MAKEKFIAVRLDIFHFKAAKHHHLVVHDRDLRSWALEENKKMVHSIPNFKVTSLGLWKWKRSNKIVSRKVTKRVICGSGASQVLNTDQISFKKEIHSGRTLEFRGTKTVESIVQYMHVTANSYTF
ncbi:hypothetical protein J437_LFUL005938 [Ladona fulva]|uniref:Uncharacterized protein n=1 Tax=Ladona fulva TaxID=123851 RepID=A0A8K0JZH2_LADFU|nr:hypothetical protein J437_LFUL005938 [Ladona fulva]